MSLIPASMVKAVAKLVVTSLFDVVRSAWRVKAKPVEEPFPLSHKAVRHQQDQIQSATRRR